MTDDALATPRNSEHSTITTTTSSGSPGGDGGGGGSGGGSGLTTPTRTPRSGDATGEVARVLSAVEGRGVFLSELRRQAAPFGAYGEAAASQLQEGQTAVGT